MLIGTMLSATPDIKRAPMRADRRVDVRSQLELDVREAIDVSDASGRICAVLALDLGRFRAISDIVGHSSAAALLQAATERLAGTVDGDNQIVPLGGDEFAVILPSLTSAAEADALADQLLDVLGRPYEFGDGPMLVRPSIGIASYPADAANAAALLQRADEALYWAKRRGQARACRFDPALHQDLVGRRLLERDLRTALATGGFGLEWQPFVAAASGALLGYEAFLRWDRPGHGPVPPQEMMAVAEASDLAASIDAWVLDAACREAARWQAKLRVAVNVSPAWLKQNDVATRVSRALTESGLPAGRLELDIDSRGFAHGTEQVSGEIAQLKRLGVRLALNDFGNGCSMLGQLKDLPFDKMKLNRALLVGLGSNPKVDAVMRTALHLGKALGIDVCATGVEARAEFDMLVQLGCGELQGSFIASPQKTAMPATAHVLDAEPYQLSAVSGIAVAVVLGVAGWGAVGVGARWLWTLIG